MDGIDNFGTPKAVADDMPVGATDELGIKGASTSAGF